ncbi:putative CoA-substrate-specific enzyme activase [Thermotoga petrophila RKU-1]|uniref:Putative CoA-substrate-specific enzyme activase n=1 Tax=Thermotoga petrophila (strain ATCC BAA-488 / DSM 13995 / JCM 10881 / RKU-1) TaxID=390874 RepID=A5IJT9_THEP1|nr:acyl-CoA dehydratase activase [Thermotoga petrophila]ABQ46462.1 putative CoA-substrate-specific enzyme activase [Thermotoga petrophila RKU-1]
MTGVCIGSSSVSFCGEREKGNLPHNGDPLALLSMMVPAFLDEGPVVITGRKTREIIDLPQISEAEATEIAYRHLMKKYGKVEAVVSAGGENTILYRVNDKGIITGIYTGSKCASGTGEFFLQQLQRMGISLEEANGVEVEDYYELSSRCTVFCKSDCTHALNKGVPKELVLNGLGKVMADKIVELAHKAGVKKILLVGGTTRNKLMLKHLKKVLEVIVPEEALFFEAYGAYLWGKLNRVVSKKTFVIKKEKMTSFPTHEPLKKYLHMVEFKEMPFQEVRDGDVCVLGIDVGSTTTKAVLMRYDDEAILAGVYLRTLGDPIRAARQCYSSILEQLNGTKVKIIGLGVTGSGRKIVGLYSQTDAVYNEIMAHAKAAARFDPEVDTIFEIGGQDAKYTYLVNGVPADYAMNEACSAGTGSFLEEAAGESLGVHYTEIGDLALRGENPPNFSDQCAAFIGSDVKTAVNEGISKEDICAGLVYSVCMNYLNRVKGSRPVGKKIFMQGGVCYNKAVPVAMAALVGKNIVVPPHPGLMGAYGVALLTKENLELGFLEKKEFKLKELISREVRYRGTFICPGGKEKCDRKCEIRIIEIDGKRFPFGGACNKYENVLRHTSVDSTKYNFVKNREKYILHFESEVKGTKTIGLSRSLAMNNLFPLFYTFLTELGFDVVVPEKSDRRGWEMMNSEFCFPVELSHGYMYDLISKNPDLIFVPRLRGIRVENSENYNVFCPFVQSEADWLTSAFPELEEKLVTGYFDFSRGDEKEEFLRVAERLGRSREEGERAFEKAWKIFNERFNLIKKQWNEFLKVLDESEFGVVLFGRSYNAFSSDANMGVPEKFATRGIPIINFDSIPFEDEKGYRNMYWSWGEMILKASRFVEKHPKLFGVYITNFSCGPDSFIISYFRDIMAKKPSLVLELDSHTADAGIETRIEAFIDIVKSYLKLQRGNEERKSAERPRTVLEKNTLYVITPDGERLRLNDERVKVVFPSMGQFGSQCLSAAFRYYGVKSDVCPPPDVEEFKLGRGNSLSKECLPLHLTLGSLIKYIREKVTDDEIVLYFMPETMGPCRFGQYNVFMNLWLDRNNVRNVTLFGLNSENAYAGLGIAFRIRAWLAVVVSDVFFDVERAVMTLARDKEEARKVLEGCREKILISLANDSLRDFFKTLDEVSKILSGVEMIMDYEKAPKVLLTGEIYVRRDEFSRKYLENLMERNGIIMHISPVHEWIYYTDYLYLNRLISPNSTRVDRLKKRIEILVKRYIEKRVKKTLEKSGFYRARMVDVEAIVESAKDYLNPKLTGEAILTIGTVLHEIVNHYDGIISIGPFGCMPSRIAEAIVKRGLKEQKRETTGVLRKVLDEFGDLPVIHIESDGNPFTPTVQSKLEAFMFQVRRLRNYLNGLLNTENTLEETEETLPENIRVDS